MSIKQKEEELFLVGKESHFCVDYNEKDKLMQEEVYSFLMKL